jgi:ubiquinone/menaquinone biosynthesis C-methylase UbiE
MESDEECHRLDVKTDVNAVEEQALWAQVRPGMRVADLGCGSGKTTSVLGRIVQPGGTAVGADISKERIEFAQSRYASPGVEFVRKDIRLPMDDMGSFDLVWVRFVLEYFRNTSFELVRKISDIIKPGGTLCLIDLDYNCMSHFEMPERLEKSLMELIMVLEEKANFDPYVGRKLYSYLYKLGFADIRVRVGAHHLIYGDLGAVDAYNWLKKMEIASRRIGFDFPRYSSGYKGYVEEFTAFFNDPGRFTYTPLISVCGYKSNPLRKPKK